MADAPSAEVERLRDGWRLKRMTDGIVCCSGQEQLCSGHEPPYSWSATQLKEGGAGVFLLFLPLLDPLLPNVDTEQAISALGRNQLICFISRRNREGSAVSFWCSVLVCGDLQHIFPLAASARARDR